MDKENNKISNPIRDKSLSGANGVKGELKKSILIFILLLLFWASGAVVDTALWGHETYRTPDWLIKNLPLFWLVLNQFLLPLLILLIVKPKLNTLILYLSAAFSGSVLWDLIYSVLTRGRLISDSLERWFTLDFLNLIIGVGQSQVIYFHISRLLISVALFYWLYRRLKKSLFVFSQKM
ncbi:MAG: hypothetical protein PHR36_02000 [Patescibacteria group bacterium]|nr:hypothetical protein [Patescibacteria group bacterium]